MITVPSPRIVIYGMGQYGQYVVRMAVKKNWRIVAALNRAGPKVGQDAGRLAGLDQDLGVTVQDCDRVDYTTLDADVGIVAMTDRLVSNFPAYQRLMNAGINVICHGGEAYYPAGADAQLAGEINRIAKANDVTFTGTGIWDVSRTWLALVVTGNCTDIKSLFHRSITNSEGFDLKTVLLTGTGMSVEEFQEKIVSKGPGVYGNLYTLVLQHVLDALGYGVTSCTERREPVLSDRPYYCATLQRELTAGVCLGTRYVVEATTREGITATGHMEVRPLFQGEVEHMLWSIDGTPSSTVTIERRDSRYATASSMFNRIPDVIAAPPGIQLVSNLGPMKHTALR